MNHVSYELAKRLKEAGVEWKPMYGDFYKGQDDGKVYVVYMNHQAIHSKALWLPTSDDLKKLIHERGYEKIWVSDVQDAQDLADTSVLVHCFKNYLDSKHQIGASSPTEPDALALALLQIIEKEKPSIKDILNKATSTEWENRRLVNIRWDNEPLTAREYEVFLEQFPQFKKPKTCGECGCYHQCSVHPAAFFCPRHPKVIDTAYYYPVEPTNTACPNCRGVE
jgi:hypothetical protein